LGHSINLLRSKCRYQTHSGYNSPEDWSEFPSQLVENLFYEPSILRELAIHYETGEPLSESTIKNFIHLQRFNGPGEEYFYAKKGWVDLFSTLCNPNKYKNLDDLERDALKQFGESPACDERILPSHHHSFGGGYEGNYSAYQRIRPKADFVFELFKRKGFLNPSLKAGFKRALEAGGSRISSELLKSAESGHRYSIEPFLIRRGLVDDPYYNNSNSSPAYNVA
jgi:peptidyl-dipeptidase Dcp